MALQAEDSKLAGDLTFRRKQGWAHDSILNWCSRDDSVIWNIDVLHPGRYEVTLMIGSGAADIGSTVQIEVGGVSVQVEIQKAHNPMPAQETAHDRTVVWTSGPVPTMTWIPLAFQPIRLEKGPAQLIVRTAGLPANSGFELKEARLRRVE